MALISIFPKSGTLSADEPVDEGREVIAISAEGPRSQSIQRLQVGFSGLAAMALLIGLAQVIFDRAQQSEAGTVPAAASTVAPAKPAPVQNDPLAEAGVVPDLPSEPVSQPTQQPAIMPEQGDARPKQ
jgi:hypothetical protein